MLIFMKTAKVWRGNERMVKQLGSEVAVGLYTACTHTHIALPTLEVYVCASATQAFLTTMLGQVTVDMGAFMYLLAASVLCMAFALMLLRPDAEEFTSFGSSIFTTYALLMFADGVGAHDLYQGPRLLHTPHPVFPHVAGAEACSLPCAVLISHSWIRAALPADDHHVARRDHHAERSHRDHG